MIIKKSLILIVGIVILSGCTITSTAEDICANSARQGECRLIQAQSQSTAEARISTLEADTAQRQQLATTTARQQQLAETLQPQQQHQQMQLTLVAGDMTLNAAIAQPTATAVAATATAVAWANQATITATNENRRLELEIAQDNIQATISQTYVIATLDAAAVLHNQKDAEQRLVAVKEVLLTVFYIVLCGALTTIIILGAWASGRALIHKLRVNASTVRYGANNARIAILDDAGNLLDPEQQIGAHMLTDGRGQPSAVPDFEQQQQQWQITVEHAMRNQRVHISENSSGSSTHTRPALAIEAPATAVDPTLNLEPSALANQLPPPPPPFIKMLETWQPTAAKVLFAFDNNGPIFGNINALLSVKILGFQGFGKTTLLRLIFVQCQILGARAIIWDTHGNIAEDLVAADAYMSVADIEKSIAVVEHELQDRIQRRIYHDHSQRWLILIDEFELLAESCPAVLHIVRRIVREGRKYGISCLITGKAFPASLFEGSATRDNFAVGYSLRTTKDQARIAGFDRSYLDVIPTLPRGYALMQTQAGLPQVVALPDLTLPDLKQILAASQPLPTASGTGQEQETGRGGEVVEDVDSLERERVRQLIRDNKSNTRIIAELWGIHGGGHAYQEAAKKLTKILSTLV